MLTISTCCYLTVAMYTVPLAVLFLFHLYKRGRMVNFEKTGQTDAKHTEYQREGVGQQTNTTAGESGVTRRGRGRFKAPSTPSPSQSEMEPNPPNRTGRLHPQQEEANQRGEQTQNSAQKTNTACTTTETSLPKTAEPKVKGRGRGRFKAPPSIQGSDETAKDTKNSEQQHDTVDQLADNMSKLNFQEAKQQVCQNRRRRSSSNNNSGISYKMLNDSKANQATRTEIVNDVGATDSTTVLECYDFPSSYKTSHLREMFQEYAQMRGGYSIKWIDNTHALIIFQHPQTAKKAYVDHIHNPVAKVRPYKEQAEKKVPATAPRRSNMAVKRLIFGALGTKVPTATLDQRQAERELLNKARRQEQAQQTLNKSQENRE